MHRRNSDFFTINYIIVATIFLYGNINIFFVVEANKGKVEKLLTFCSNRSIYIAHNSNSKENLLKESSLKLISFYLLNSSCSNEHDRKSSL